MILDLVQSWWAQNKGLCNIFTTGAKVERVLSALGTKYVISRKANLVKYNKEYSETCLERPHFYGKWGGLPRQVPLYYSHALWAYSCVFSTLIHDFLNATTLWNSKAGYEAHLHIKHKDIHICIWNCPWFWNAKDTFVTLLNKSREFLQSWVSAVCVEKRLMPTLQ